MLKFIRRDLVGAMPVLPLVLLWELLNAPVRFYTGTGYFVGSLLLTILLSTGVTFLDWRHETEGFFAALPVSRQETVLGRFAVAGVALFIGAGLCFGLGWACDALRTPGPSRAGALLSVDALGFYVLVVVGAASIFYPLYYALGMARGWVVFGLVLSLGMAVLLLSGPQQPARPAVIDSVGSTVRPVLLAGERAAVGGLRALRADHGWLLWLALVMGLPALAVLGSVRLSTRLHERRDL